MKQILLLAIVVMSFASCQQNTSKTNSKTGNAAEVANDNSGSTIPASPDAAVMSFENENYDFGKVAQGEKVYYSYKFKNTGKSPLIIQNATASCGCTVPEIPKEPIKPGAEGVIKVVFNSTGKSGKQEKVITVTSNAQPNVASLHLTGEIKE